MKKAIAKVMLSCLFLSVFETAVAMEIEDHSIDARIPLATMMKTSEESITAKKYEEAYQHFMAALSNQVYCPGGAAFERIIREALNGKYIDCFTVEDYGINQESIHKLELIPKKIYIDIIFPKIYKMLIGVS